MLLDHPGIYVPQVLRHHQQRNAIHHRVRSPRVAEDVSAEGMFAPVRIRPKSAYLPRLFCLECVDEFALIRHNPGSKYGSKAGSWRALFND
jgi:hypothetical protein